MFPQPWRASHTRRHSPRQEATDFSYWVDGDLDLGGIALANGYVESRPGGADVQGTATFGAWDVELTGVYAPFEVELSLTGELTVTADLVGFGELTSIVQDASCAVEEVTDAALCGGYETVVCGVETFACGVEEVACGVVEVTSEALCGLEEAYECGTDILSGVANCGGEAVECGVEVIEDVVTCLTDLYVCADTGPPLYVPTAFCCDVPVYCDPICEVPIMCQDAATCEQELFCEQTQWCEQDRLCTQARSCTIAGTCELVEEGVFDFGSFRGTVSITVSQAGLTGSANGLLCVNGGCSTARIGSVQVGTDGLELCFLDVGLEQACVTVNPPTP